jgi:hypothetical protein
MTLYLNQDVSKKMAPNRNMTDFWVEAKKSSLLGLGLPCIITCTQLLVANYSTMMVFKVSYPTFLRFLLCPMLEIWGSQGSYENCPDGMKVVWERILCAKGLVSLGK